MGLGKIVPNCFLACYLFQLLLIDIEVRIHVLNIVLIFQRFQQPDHVASLMAFQLGVVLRHHPDLRHLGRDARLLHRFQH